MEEEANIQTLAFYLEKTLSHDATHRVKAEAYLKKFNKEFSRLSLILLQSQQYPIHIKQTSAVLFKNFVRTCWSDRSAIPEPDRQFIREMLPDLMLSLPPVLQKIIGTSLTYIAAIDFPHRWNLLPQLVNRLDSSEVGVRNGVLKTFNSIFKKFRHQYKTDEVLIELKLILEHLQEPLLQIFKMTIQQIESSQYPSNLPALFQSANLLSKIFYSLNYIDLPEYFEDHMAEWMQGFRFFLNYQTTDQGIVGDNYSHGVLQKIQSAILKNTNLYVEKYETEFVPYLQTLVEDTWKLLTRLSQLEKDDLVATSAIYFLTSVAKSVCHEIFKEEETLNTICQSIVIPNITLRDEDIEQFEDDPREYVRRDVEGSDAATRRRCASELVKGLRKHYEGIVTNIFNAHIKNLLDSYDPNRADSWKAKDAALYLTSALAVHTETGSAGVLSANQNVPIAEIFHSHVVPELTGDISRAPILKASCLKFVNSFRRVLPGDLFDQLFPVFVKYLNSPSFVVHSYASICIERYLIILDDGVVRYDGSRLQPHLNSVMAGLFNALKNQSSQESLENHYIMRAIMRVLHVAQDASSTMLPECFTQLVNIIKLIYNKSVNASFVHFLFESLSCIMRIACKANPAIIQEFEEPLFPIFMQVLGDDDADSFQPYVFQIVRLMMEIRGGGLSQHYTDLLQTITKREYWDPKEKEDLAALQGNIQALVELVKAYLMYAPDFVISSGSIEPILGVWRKLLSSLVNDHFAFELSRSIVNHLPLNSYEQFLSLKFQLIFTRLQEAKTAKLVNSFIIFLATFINKHGPEYVVNRINNIQKDIFFMVMQSLWIPNCQRISSRFDRLNIALAMVRMAVQCPLFLQESYSELWLNSIIGAILLIETGKEDHQESELEQASVHAGDLAANANTFSKLTIASGVKEVFSGEDPRALLINGLKQLQNNEPRFAINNILQMVMSVNQQAGTVLQTYLQ
eukprot:TRINITY_DN7787_c0_g1_i1.p1 TRINITY_DN7787_c0_g1~~TRINITY_DN7787_c0_g1_i1.p1  ORF type:complete len:982 (-),score=176.56 TRINITY_DN7787_c0_g1_i1:71-2974(-)